MPCNVEYVSEHEIDFFFSFSDHKYMQYLFFWSSKPLEQEWEKVSRQYAHQLKKQFGSKKLTEEKQNSGNIKGLHILILES